MMAILQLLPVSIQAKSERDTLTTRFRPCVHLEAAGAHQFMSLNFEVFVSAPFGEKYLLSSVGLSAGIGLGALAPSFMPVIVRALVGSEYAMELGVGTLIQYKEEPDKVGWYNWSTEIFNLGFHIGYRYQPLDSGLLYRVCIWGIMDTGTGRLFPTLGFGIGYAF